MTREPSSSSSSSFQRTPGASRCARCLFLTHMCLCAEIPRIATRTQVVIVRHHLERWRSSNSGRLAHLALENSVLVDHGGAEGPAVLPPLEGAWLVFPEGEPQRTCPNPAPRQLVVLDATWSQARRMFRKLNALRGLPILRLPEGSAQLERLREAPSPDRVSTIEAIAGALRLVEEDSQATVLEHLFRRAVQQVSATGRNLSRSPTLDKL